MGILIFTSAPIQPGDYARSEVAMASPLVTSPDIPRLTMLAKEARAVFQGRWAGICVIAEDWQNVVASSGGMLGRYRRSTSLSSYVVAYPDVPFCLLDTAEDERFAGNPFVHDQLIRFYVGVPIRYKGQAIGAVCVTDTKPKTVVAPGQLTMFQDIADRVILDDG